METLFHANEAETFLHRIGIGDEPAAIVGDQKANGVASPCQNDANRICLTVLHAVAQALLRYAKDTQRYVLIDRVGESGLEKLYFHLLSFVELRAETVDRCRQAQVV